MELCPCAIDIINFKDREIVEHSLVLIKGIVSSETNSSSELGEVECISNSQYNKWPIVCCNFRCIVLLNGGVNELRFKYKEVTKTINLEFRKRQSGFCVVPLYVLFNNGTCDNYDYHEDSTVSTCSRIGFCAKILQGFYAEKLYENGFGHKTFQLIEDISDKFSACHVFRSKISLERARHLNPESLWETLGREIMTSSLGNVRYKYLAVISLSPLNGESYNRPEIALGSGGLALIDSRPVFTWPCSVNQILPCFQDSTRLAQPLCYNVWYKGTRGGCCSASIGSLCHELGHTFDLGHPNFGIMSTDFHLFHNAFLPVSIDSQDLTTTFNLQFIPDITTVLAKVNGSSSNKSNKRLSPTKQLKKLIDQSSFTPGCVTILSCHKWFNDVDRCYKIKFDCDRVLLQSEAGLKVVQLRGENGKVIKSWECSGAKTEHMVLPRMNSCITVFAMDNYGNISKFPFNDQFNTSV